MNTKCVTEAYFLKRLHNATAIKTLWCPAAAVCDFGLHATGTSKGFVKFNRHIQV